MGGPSHAPEEGGLTCTGVSRGDDLHTGRNEVSTCHRPGVLRATSDVAVTYLLGGVVKKNPQNQMRLNDSN